MFDYTFLAEKKPSIKLLFLVLIFIGSMIIIPIFLMLVALPIWGNDIVMQGFQINSDSLNYMIFVQFFTQIGVFGFSAWFFARLVVKKPFNYLKITKKISLKIIFLAVVSIVTIIPLSSYFLQLSQSISFPESLKWLENSMRLQEEFGNAIMEQFLKVNSIGGLLFNLLFLAVLPAFCEELLFRGALQNIVSQMVKNKHIVVIITATVFSAIHFQFFSFFSRFALGIILGYSVILSGSLIPSIVAHFVNNAISVISAYLYFNGYSSQNWQETGSFSNQIWIVIITAAISIICIFAINKKREKEIWRETH